MAGEFGPGICFVVVGKIAAATAFITALWCQDLSRQGAEAMRAGRYQEAERIYRELVKQSPDHAGWHGNLGLALHSQGRYREAIDPLERSLKIRSSAGFSTVLGIDYLKIGEPCKAIAPLERSDRKPALADAYSGCRRFRDAAVLYEKLGNSRAAARAYWQARDYDDARRVFVTIARQHSADADFEYEYGDTLLRAEGATVALPHLERATSLVEGRAALGKAYIELRRFADAISHLEAAVSADPDLWLPLSRAYRATGRTADADSALSEYKKRQSQN